MPDVVFDIDHIDYSAFETPLTPAIVDAYRASVTAAEEARRGPQGPKTTISGSMIVGVLVAFSLCFLYSLSSLLLPLVQGRGITSWVPIELSILFGGLTFASIMQTRAKFARKNWTARAQLSVFARNNGLELRSISSAPAYPGIIFRQGDTRTATDRLTSSSGRFFDLATLEYWIRSNRSRYSVKWSYVAIRLDRKLPNMLLVAKENQGIGGSDLPATFRSDQILSLEGDFGRYFTLYCPKKYETDALYVFTPDLMALLIDEARFFDVEIVDDWMFVVVRKTLPVSASTYKWLFGIVRTVGSKAAHQTKYYHDDSVGSFATNTIAPPGRALRRNVSVVGVVILAVVLVALIAVPIAALLLNQSVAP